MYFCWHTHKKTENCKIAFSQQTRRAAHFHGSTSPRRLTGKYASERVSERASCDAMRPPKAARATKTTTTRRGRANTLATTTKRRPMRRCVAISPSSM